MACRQLRFLQEILAKMGDYELCASSLRSHIVNAVNDVTAELKVYANRPASEYMQPWNLSKEEV